MFYILDKNNIPVEIDFSKDIDIEIIKNLVDQRRVVRMDESCATRISTIFTGINLRGSVNHPMFFETMIFRNEELNLWGRYHSWDDAYQGHIKALEAYQSVTEGFMRMDK